MSVPPLVPPPTISTFPGERIHLGLGRSGQSYLLVTHSDDGVHQAENRQWHQIPKGLAQQLSTQGGREITLVAMGPQGEWYLRSRVGQEQQELAWWGNITEDQRHPVLDYIRQHRIQHIAFGKQGRCAILMGSNGYRVWCDHQLTAELNQNSADEASSLAGVHYFQDGSGYFLSYGDQWCWQGGNSHLQAELRKADQDRIVQVAVAGDGAWIVLRGKDFVASTGISHDLTTALTRFYQNENNLREQRENELAVYHHLLAEQIQEEELRPRVQLADEEEDEVMVWSSEEWNSLNGVLRTDGRQGSEVIHSVGASLRELTFDSHQVTYKCNLEDEYFNVRECIERIDVRNLETALNEFSLQAASRQNWIKYLSARPAPTNLQTSRLKKLERCQALQEVAKELYEQTRLLQRDRDGCVSYIVEYEYRDRSNRGRLFACAQRHPGVKRLRTPTLQGMQKELRAVVAGRFCHDVDCQNSDVRLLCSLAERYGWMKIAPKLFHCRDQRNHVLSVIAEAHGIDTDTAKMLPTILCTGGNYTSWLKYSDLSEEIAFVKSLAVELQGEIRALGHKLKSHGDFEWIKPELEYLKQQGKSENAMEKALLSMIIYSSESEVSGILHQHFFQAGWRVRAKTFDGLLLEPGPDVRRHTLGEQLKVAERVCRETGWNICLVEKPLYEKQSDPIPSLVDATNVVHVLELTEGAIF